MFEKTGRCDLVRLILDHPDNRDLDAHERHDLSKRLATKKFSELEEEYNHLPPITRQTTPEITGYQHFLNFLDP